jgi:hypothetical protein
LIPNPGYKYSLLIHSWIYSYLFLYSLSWLLPEDREGSGIKNQEQRMQEKIYRQSFKSFNLCLFPLSLFLSLVSFSVPSQIMDIPFLFYSSLIGPHSVDGEGMNVRPIRRKDRERNTNKSFNPLSFNPLIL